MPDFGIKLKTIKPEGKIVYEYNPLYNYRNKNGEISDLITEGESQLNFDLEHPVDILCQKSYDGSINLILNDGKNQPRLINSRFTAKENNTYVRIDRTYDTDTNLYDKEEFEIDSSLLKKYIEIPEVKFNGVFYGGDLPVGNYVFYFKLADGDGNETDFVAESGLVSIFIGSEPHSIRGGQYNENSYKSIQFILSNIIGYDYVHVYYSRTAGADNLERSVEVKKILNRFRVRQGICSIHIAGNENTETLPVEELSEDFFIPSSAKAQAICQNMLFLGNVNKNTPEYEKFSKLSLGFVPYYKVEDEETALGSELDYRYKNSGYYKVQNIYNKVGYWNEEIYRFGVVYILNDGSLTPVYNIRGIDNVPLYAEQSYTPWYDIKIDYDTQFINYSTLENSAGVCRINDTILHDKYFQVRHFVFELQDDEDPDTNETVLTQLKKLGVRGYFFVRQKRMPTILCQAFMIGRETYSGIPCWKLEDTETGNQRWVTESFISNEGKITHDYGRRLITLQDNQVNTEIGICPEFELNQAHFNNIFINNTLNLKQVTDSKPLHGSSNHVYIDESYSSKVDSTYIPNKVSSVPDSGLLNDGNNIFRNIAGNQNENVFQYLVNRDTKPEPDNFSGPYWTFVNGNPKLQGSGQESKVKIVRGLYSPYLAIYNNSTIEPNSLVNIYIPQYDSSLMQEYFKIRINSEDSYFAITERKTLPISELKEDVYRGDCFICQFTHRINRNFQDPDAPNNDIIVDNNTWIDHYDDEEDNPLSEINRGDLNAVKIGTYLTMKFYSSTNVGLRDWDSSFPTEVALTGNKRSFHPLSHLRVDGHSKIPDSVMYNQGFSSTTGERMNFLQPFVPYIKNIFQTRVIYSDVSQTDAFKNGFRVFRGISHVDYSNQYGGITKLIEWNGDLLIVFEHAIALAKVNENALIPTDDGTLIGVGAVKPLATTPIMISTDFGSQWSESVIKTPNYVYGVDTVGKKIWRTNGKQLELISDFKVQKFLNDNISLTEKELTPIIGVRNVKTHYNAFKNDVLFTFYDNIYGFEEKVWNLCWNELQEAFVTFYSWVPSCSENIDNIFFTYDRNSSKWISKLSQAMSTKPSVNGICMTNPLIEGQEFSQQLYFKNRPVPEKDEKYYDFELVRDNFGFWKYFKIVKTYSTDNPQLPTTCTLKIKNNKYNELLKHWFLTNGKVKDPIIPCIQLNIKCTIYTLIKDEQWHYYSVTNSGFYEQQVYLTLKDIYDNISRIRDNGRWIYPGEQPLTDVNKTINVTIDTNKEISINLPTFETKFWKHGFAGIIDIQDKIKPCFWYNKQHPFELDYVVGNDSVFYKRFDNLIIASNNVIPESIHYTIIGDTYNFAKIKPAIYWRQEATKAFYQFNGSDILFDKDVFTTKNGYYPLMITSDDYIETHNSQSLRPNYSLSNTYKDVLFTLLYFRQDTFNEIEDFYKRVISGQYDYPNLTGCEVLWNKDLNEFSLCNHVKCKDILNVGRTRGNIQYVNDGINVQITPINLVYKNNTWLNCGTSELPKMLPKLFVSNTPQEVFDYTGGQIKNEDFPPELGVALDNNGNIIKSDEKKYIVSANAQNINEIYNINLLDNSSLWLNRQEIKLMDKFMKVKIRYTGNELVNILAINTIFNV